MTGPLTWKDGNALPEQSSPQYFLVLDAFASGGTTKWSSVANVKSALGVTTLEGYFTNGIAKKATNDSDGNAINTTYLKKSGGTVTGFTTFQSDSFGGALAVKRNDTNSAAIRYSNSNGIIAYLGFTGGDEKALKWWDSNAVSHKIWPSAAYLPISVGQSGSDKPFLYVQPTTLY